MKKFLIVLGILLLVLAGLGAYAVKYAMEQLEPVDPSGAVPALIVEIPEGSTAGDIGQLLQDKGIIRSALAFKELVRYRDKGNELKVGFFSLSPGQSPEEILEVIVSGKTVKQMLTVPEGLKIDQVAKLAEKHKICSAQEFLDIVSAHGKDYGDFPACLEGYLLPDTYELPWVCSAQELVGIMTARFDELARPLVDKSSPFSLHDTVVLASLVEREAQVDSERPVIAGVYLNRVEKGMLLECDATVQYALGEQKEFLLYKDLEIDSPYNTYRYPGLPPGPICSPGLQALKAAAHPARHDKFYYVRNDVKGDGSHVFSRNFTEHNQAIGKYQR